MQRLASSVPLCPDLTHLIYDSSAEKWPERQICNSEIAGSNHSWVLLLALEV